MRSTSKFISLILRHKPEVIGITLDEHGWADVQELIQGVNATGRHHLTLEALEEIVRTDEKGDEAEWGIVMTQKMQNKGYGTEALTRSVEYGFGELELRRIYLAVYADNPRAIHVYEKCGFREYDRNAVDVFTEVVRNYLPPHQFQSDAYILR